MTLADALRGRVPELKFHGERRVIRGDDGPMQSMRDVEDTRPLMVRIREWCEEVRIVTTADVSEEFGITIRHAVTLVGRLQRRNFLKHDGFGHGSGGRLPKRYRVVEK